MSEDSKLEVQPCECCAYKNKPRSSENKEALIKRINRAQGQLNGIKQMIEDDRYCKDILIQLSAVEKAVSAVSREILSEHMKTCVVDDIQKGNTEIIDEVLQLVTKYM